jgi:hypothetical protein
MAAGPELSWHGVGLVGMVLMHMSITCCHQFVTATQTKGHYHQRASFTSAINVLLSPKQPRGQPASMRSTMLIGAS